MAGLSRMKISNALDELFLIYHAWRFQINAMPQSVPAGSLEDTKFHKGVRYCRKQTYDHCELRGSEPPWVKHLLHHECNR